MNEQTLLKMESSKEQKKRLRREWYNKNKEHIRRQTRERYYEKRREHQRER